jgi:hypothetical protein
MDELKTAEAYAKAAEKMADASKSMAEAAALVAEADQEFCKILIRDSVCLTSAVRLLLDKVALLRAVNKFRGTHG